MKPLNEYDREGILSDEVFVEIFEQQDEIYKARLLLSCQERAKELGCKGRFDQLVKTYKKVKKDIDRKSPSMVDNWTDFTGKYDRMKCGSWLASDKGVFTFSKDYFNEVVVCYHPILPVERLKNLETGEEQIKLAYRRNKVWKEIIVPKDIISSASKIVSLSKLGVSVTSENARNLVKYLSDVENLNEDAIPVQESSSKLGWIEGGFLPYDTGIIFDGDIKFRHIYESMHEQGSEEAWMKLLKRLRLSGKAEIKIFMATSFASVLVGLLGALPFIVDLWGETGGGKSVTMMLAASIWADPSEKAFIGDFESSDVGLEIRSDLLNHLPLMLDDSSKTNSRVRDNFEGVVYSLCSGKGKSRSNKELGMRRENKWCNAILTNGEHPLSSYVSQGGAINRILELESGRHVYDDPQEVLDVIRQNYGFAGKRFVEVVKMLGEDEIRRIQRSIQEDIHDDESMQKQEISLSIILTADRLATDYIFKDGRYIDYADAKKLLISRDELSENERCYQYVMSEIAINASRFESVEENRGEIWGTIRNGYAAIYLNVFDRMCERGHYSKKSFVKWAGEKGLMEFDKGRKNKTVKVNGKAAKCIYLKMEEENSTRSDKDGFVDIDEYEQAELPFD